MRCVVDLFLFLSVDLSVDLRDAIGDRLYLSRNFRRDGVSLSPKPQITPHAKPMSRFRPPST